MTSDDPPMPNVRWRERSLLFLAAGGLLVVAGIATRDPTPLFLALPLLIAPAAAALGLPTGGRLTLRWDDRGRGRAVRLAVKLTPLDGPLAHPIDVSLTPPAPLSAPRPAEVRSTDPQMEFELDWSSPTPPLVRVPPPRVVVRDPLDLAERELSVVGDPRRIERYPAGASRLGRAALRRTTGLPGERRSRALGSAGEFFGIREAAEGDPSRQINWAASARTGRWLANEFLQERTGDLVIVLDLRPTPLGRGRDESLAAISRSAAQGITDGFLREKARVGLAVFGEFLVHVPLGSGRAHRIRISAALDAAAISETAGLPERLAIALRRAFPPGVTTLLLTPLADDDAGALVTHLRRRGFPVHVLSPSPIPPTGSPIAGPREVDLATRWARLDRRRRVADLWKEAPVFDWSDFWSLAALTDLLSGAERGGRR